MADLKIGADEITFDLEQITITEHRKFSKGSMMDEEDDELLAKVIDKPVEWVRELSQPNYKRLLQGYFKKAREPLADPN